MLRRSLLACAILFVGVATLGVVSRRRSPPAAEQVTRISYKTGDQILFVYIGSEDCKFSLSAKFADLVTSARNSVSKQAKLATMDFSSLGVSAGPSAQAGIRYLARFGSFDQISSGRGWLNDSMEHYVWQTLIGDGAVPQIVVVKRHLDVRDPGYEFSNEKVLVRALGELQISKWVQDGAPIGRPGV